MDFCLTVFFLHVNLKLKSRGSENHSPGFSRLLLSELSCSVGIVSHSFLFVKSFLNVSRETFLHLFVFLRDSVILSHNSLELYGKDFHIPKLLSSLVYVRSSVRRSSALPFTYFLPSPHSLPPTLLGGSCIVLQSRFSS